MSILKALKADHEEAKTLLDEIVGTGDAKKRGAMFAEFKKKMTAHSRSEEKVFYRPLEQTAAGKEDALEGAVEHQVVDRLIAELARTRNKNADKWTARCRVLKQLIEHHVEEEEGEFFEIARQEFDQGQLDEMAVEFAKEKRRHGVESDLEPMAAE